MEGDDRVDATQRICAVSEPPGDEYVPALSPLWSEPQDRL